MTQKRTYIYEFPYERGGTKSFKVSADTDFHSKISEALYSFYTERDYLCGDHIPEEMLNVKSAYPKLTAFADLWSLWLNGYSMNGWRLHASIWVIDHFVCVFEKEIPK